LFEADAILNDPSSALALRSQAKALELIVKDDAIAPGGNGGFDGGPIRSRQFHVVPLSQPIGSKVSWIRPVLAIPNTEKNSLFVQNQ
jgi:hypothetical protein